ncbi:MAG: hypothetical protein C4527_27695 [Candidatus Omnitrophota bacterium]|jgi:hypothetical protein|nr:MAG: hypothetical protein C4527_27695 [Candidatus Omnitrophota bacterium]
MNTDLPISKELNYKIHLVAHQYQRALLLRRWLRFGLISLGCILLFTLFLFLFHEFGWPRVGLLLLFLLTESIAFWFTLIAPSRKSVTLEQIAFYIEEHHPELENRIVTAVSLNDGRREGTSAEIIERFFQESKDHIHRFTFFELLDTGVIFRMSWILALFVLISLSVFIWFRNLWTPDSMRFSWRESVGPVIGDFTVKPGNIRVRKGYRQVILCEFGRMDEKATIHWRTQEGNWNSDDMKKSLSDHIFHHTFETIQNTIPYRVHVGRWQSETYTITVRIPPRVDSIDVTYHYPAYLGLEAKETPNGGNLTVIEGTRVVLHVWVNKKLEKAELRLGEGERFLMDERADHLWEFSFIPVSHDSYSIHLTDLEGEASEFDAKYDIRVQPDKLPEIQIDFPRQDYEVTLLEEVPFDFRVRDDFGVTKFGIQYEIVGKEPVRLAISSPGENETEIHGEYLLYLEEQELEVGDVITWSIWANDGKPDRSEYEQLGDPYFLEIRPFRRMFEEAISNAGANRRQNDGRQGGEGREAADQKDIIIAIWNLRREFRQMEVDKYVETRSNIIEAQQQALTNMSESGSLTDGENQFLLVQIRQAMKDTLDALRASEPPDPSEKLTEASRHAQKAYQLIQKREPDRSQIQQQRGQRGQAGNQGRPEISELELNRRRNFYEQERNTQSQLEETHESLNKIKELAQRQKNINEEISKLISELQKEEAEEERKRRLEQLQEEEQRNLENLDELERDLAMGNLQDPQIRESLRRLQDAREQMNRSLENLEKQELQPARMSGARAMNALNDMQDQLRQYSRHAAAQRMAELQQRMNVMVEKQQSIRDRVTVLKEEEDLPSMTLNPEMDAEKEAIREEKNELSQEFLDAITMANDLAERSDQSQNLLSSKLSDWVRQTSQKGIVEDINQEERLPLIHYGIWERAIEQENIILDKIREAATDLNRLSNFMIENDLEAMRMALEQLREVIPADAERGQIARADVDSASIAQTSRQAGLMSELRENATEREGNASVAEAQGTIRAGNRPSEQESQDTSRQQGNPERDANPRSAPSLQAGERGEEYRNGERFEGSGGPPSMQRFIESDYREWLESLRNAEQLLPGERPYRQHLSEIREEIEAMRLGFRQTRQPPKYDLFLEHVERPAVAIARQLEQEIERLVSEQEFVLMDEDRVPVSYQKSVADYFKSLTEDETSH